MQSVSIEREREGNDGFAEKEANYKSSSFLWRGYNTKRGKIILLGTFHEFICTLCCWCFLFLKKKKFQLLIWAFICFFLFSWRTWALIWFWNESIFGIEIVVFLQQCLKDSSYGTIFNMLYWLYLINILTTNFKYFLNS